MNMYGYQNRKSTQTRLGSVFLISSYVAPLAQRASYLAQHSSLFGPDGAVYIIVNSINSLLIIGSICIPNGAHANNC